MALSKESRLFFSKLSKVWQNFKDYTYLEGINLSSEQISIIEQDAEQLLIEGYAGTGKSLTLLYKFINVLLREEGKKVLFVTFNSTLIEDTKKRLRSSKEYCNNVDKHIAHVMTFHEMATNILKELKVIEIGIGRLSVEKINKLQGDAFVRIAGIHAKYTEKSSEIFKSLTKDERLYSTHDIKFVTEEIAWLKAMGFTTLERYLSTERTGRSKSIRLTRNQRKTIFKIYEEYQGDLESFKYGNRLDLEDYALKLIYNNHLITDDIKYDYIFVDEVQDLDPMQIMALCNLTKKSIILSGDAKQKIYKKCPVKYEELGLNLKEKGRRKILNKNYRSTEEIVRLANSLNFYDSEVKFDSKRFVKNGERPTIYLAKDITRSAKYIANKIQNIFENNPNKSIAIIHREEIKQKTGYKSSFRLKLEQLLLQTFSDISNYNSRFDFGRERQIFYSNAYDVKGLEFDVVFIVDFNNKYYPNYHGIKSIREENDGKDEKLINDDILEFINTEKKLLYVAMTRAKEKLYLVSNSENSKLEVSEFIYDFDFKDYKAIGFTKESIKKKSSIYKVMGNGKLYRNKDKDKKMNYELVNTSDKEIKNNEVVDEKDNYVFQNQYVINNDMYSIKHEIRNEFDERINKIENYNYDLNKIQDVVRDTYQNSKIVQCIDCKNLMSNLYCYKIDQKIGDVFRIIECNNYMKK